MPSFLCQYISEWLEQKETFVGDCKLPRYKKLAGLSTRIVVKIRERAAKDSMGQVHQSSAKSPCLWPHFFGENPALFHSCSYVFPFPFLVFFFSFLLFHSSSFPLPLSSFSSPQVGGRGVWRDGEQRHCQCQTYMYIYIYIVLLVWLQACPSSHRERSANEVVAWVSRMPSWPRKQNERIRERPLWAQRVRIVFFSCAFSRLNWPQIKVG